MSAEEIGPGGSGNAQPPLRRHLGVLDATGIGLGAIIGAGIFVVLGVAVRSAGPAIILSIALAGVVASANALSSAQLAAEYPQSGGTYEYGYRVFGAWPGFIAGWEFLASKTAAAGTVALGLSQYIAVLLPGLEIRWIATGSIVLFTLLNCAGIHRTSRVNLAIVAVSLFSLGIFAVLSLPNIRLSNFTPFAPSGVGGVLEGAALMFFAYTGYARIATLGEEVEDPRRTIPRAIGWTVGIAIILYLAVAFAAVGLVGADGLSGTGAPLSRAAEATDLPLLAGLIAAAALSAMLGVLLSQILGLSRMLFAMSRRGDLPISLGRVDPRTAVPARAVLSVGAVAAVFAATASLRGVASAAAFAILIYYGIANLCALRMPASSKIYPDFVPVIGLAGCSALLLSLPAEVVGTGLIVLLVGAGFRLIRNLIQA